DKVKTGDDGEASLILYESAIVSLEPNTEIAIADLSEEMVAIKQESGSTWNKFTGLSGLKGLEVETPDTVATVRGTEFGVDMDSIYVMEGEVEATNKNNGKKLKVLPGKRVLLRDKLFQLEDMNDEMKEKLINKMEKNIERLKEIRELEMIKHPKLMGIVKSRLKTDDDGIRERLQKLDDGRYDEDALQKKSPIKMESIEKFTFLTKKVKNQQMIVDELRSGAEMPVDPYDSKEMPPDPLESGKLSDSLVGGR
ncbi:MAG: FecR domain-containing protein, partial [Candidatus Thorarchaeota archaeon]